MFFQKVGYRVLQRDIERERGHHQHKQQRQPRSDVRAHIAEQTEAQRKLKDYHHNSRRHSQRHQIHEDPSEGFQIVFYLIGSTQRVNGFHEAREDKCESEEGAANAAKNMEGFILSHAA